MNKICTTIEQSKKLIEILPIESADMWWNFYSVTTDNTTPQIIHIDTPWVGSFNWNNEPDNIPCWSLAALFSMLPKSAYLEKSSSTELCRLTLPVELISSDWNLEPVDACIEVILKLHEEKLL